MIEADTNPPTAFTPAAADTVPWSAWWMLTVLLVLHILSFVDRIIISMLVDPIKATLGLSDVQMGLIIGPAFGVAYCIFGYVFGLAADRLSRRVVIFTSVTIWSLSAGLSGLASNFASLFAFRFSVGVGESGLSPAAYSLMAARFPRKRLTTAMAIFQTGSKLGSALGFTLGGASIVLAMSIQDTNLPIVGQMEPWQIALALTGLPGVALALLVFTFREPSLPGTTANVVPMALLPFLRKEAGALVPMALGFALVAIAMYSLMSWVPTYIGRQFGWHPGQYGPVLGIIGVLGAGSMVIKGMIVDWLYSRGMEDAHLRFFTWLLACTMPIAAVAFFITDAWWFLVAYGALQVVALQFVVFMGATLQLFVPHGLRGQLVGLFLGFFNLLGLGVGPTFTAFLTDYVFQDEAKLGYSLATTICITIPLAWLFLRLALKPVSAALIAQRQSEKE